MTTPLERSKAKRTLKERLKAAVTDTPWDRAIIKATDSAKTQPKQKHVKVLVLSTFQTRVPPQEIAEGLIDRLHSTKSWNITLKSLLVIHKLLRDGHERFGQYMATRAQAIHFQHFHDLSGKLAAPLTAFVEGYAKYLQTKLTVIQKLGKDICHATAPKKFAFLKNEKGPKLLVTIELIEQTMDELIKALKTIRASGATQFTDANMYEQPLVRAVVSLLLNDALNAFVRLNDAMVNVLERYLSVTKTEAISFLDLYEVFARQSIDVDDIIDVARRQGLMDGRQLPTLSEAPLKILPTLRRHVNKDSPSTVTTTVSSSPSSSTAVASSLRGDAGEVHVIGEEANEYQQNPQLDEEQSLQAMDAGTALVVDMTSDLMLTHQREQQASLSQHESEGHFGVFSEPEALATHTGHAGHLDDEDGADSDLDGIIDAIASVGDCDEGADEGGDELSNGPGDGDHSNLYDEVADNPIIQLGTSDMDDYDDWEAERSRAEGATAGDDDHYDDDDDDDDNINSSSA